MENVHLRFFVFTPRLVEDTSCVRAMMTCTTRSTLTKEHTEEARRISRESRQHEGSLI